MWILEDMFGDALHLVSKEALSFSIYGHED